MNQSNLPQHPCLIVEDDISFLSIATAALERAGIRFEVALTGRAAVDQARRSTYAAILLDLRLPDMDGLDVMREIRSNGRLMPPVIVVTGGGTIDKAVASMKLGAVDFLQKPIPMPEMVDALLAQIAPGDSQVAAEQVPRAHAAERLAPDVLHIIRANEDTSTVRAWAERLDVSEQVLRGRCFAAGVMAKSALDLGRLLRLALIEPAHRARPEEYLGSRDTRTLRALLDRAGVSEEQFHSATASDVIRLQTGVRNDTLLRLLARALPT